MAKICDFGSAADLAKDGYGIIEIITCSEAQALEEYAERDVLLVRGPALMDDESNFEFAVMARSKSCPVKSWDSYTDSAGSFTHQIEFDDQRASNGQCYLTVSALDDNPDDMLSVTAEVNTSPMNEVDRVPCLHVHFDSDALAFSAFKVHNQIYLRLEEGVEIASIHGPAGRLYRIS